MSTANEKRIKAVMAGREVAKNFYKSIANDWVAGTGADFGRGFVEEMTSLFPTKKQDEPKAVKRTPMAQLKFTVLTFGTYKGATFDQVPLGYLDWMVLVQQKSVKEIREYLTHPELNRSE